jgi:hypothetical protein
VAYKILQIYWIVIIFNFIPSFRFFTYLIHFCSNSFKYSKLIFSVTGLNSFLFVTGLSFLIQIQRTTTPNTITQTEN